MTMTKEDLENKLHTQIPMTQFMQLHINEISNKQLLTSAPLEKNINDKGTAFGGSLSTMTIISSWAVCYSLSQVWGYEHCSIVISKNETQFKRPVKEDLKCTTYMPSQNEQLQLQEALKTKGRATLTIHSEVLENGKVCVSFEGTYVIKVL